MFAKIAVRADAGWYAFLRRDWGVPLLFEQKDGTEVKANFTAQFRQPDAAVRENGT
jgi:hypothetical protein